MRTILIWLAAAFVFGNFYTMIAARQTLLRNGQTCYLELAPVDPRSLMQGDYMALNYAVMNQLNHDHFTAGAAAHPDTGTIIVQLDSRNVGTFVRYDDGTCSPPVRPASSTTTTAGAPSLARKVSSSPKAPATASATPPTANSSSSPTALPSLSPSAIKTCIRSPLPIPLDIFQKCTFQKIRHPERRREKDFRLDENHCRAGVEGPSLNYHAIWRNEKAPS